MSKIMAVARAEFSNFVRSKAFLIGLAMLPILWGAAFLIPRFLEDKGDVDDRRCAVVDRTGRIYSVLEEAVAERNKGVFEEDGEDRKQVDPLFLLEPYTLESDGEESGADWQLELSERVRSGELFAFLEIEEDVFGTGVATRKGARVNYFTQTPTYSDLPNWLRRKVNDRIQGVRFEEAGLDQKLIDKLSNDVYFSKLGLASRSESTGEVIEAESEDGRAIVPIAAMMLIFMLVMTVAPAGLNNVLEEKMQKISEVLVSAVSPFELMMGKLLGTVFVAGLLSLLYVGAAVSILWHNNLTHYVPTEMYFWFALYQVMALMIFGSIFSAIGAACSEMRDAQSFMMPVMFLIMTPMFMLQIVMESPNSSISVAGSLFPPATPFLMLARIGMPPGPPVWQIALSVVLTGAFSVFCVWAGSKIFRIGLLSQGQTPSFAKLAKWVFSK